VVTRSDSDRLMAEQRLDAAQRKHEAARSELQQSATNRNGSAHIETRSLFAGGADTDAIASVDAISGCGRHERPSRIGHAQMIHEFQWRAPVPLLAVDTDEIRIDSGM